MAWIRISILSVLMMTTDLDQECNILMTLETLQSRVEEQDVRLREQELNLREQKITTRELETSLDEKGDQISRLETSLSEKDVRIAELESLADEQKVETASLKQRLDSVHAVGFSAKTPKVNPSYPNQMAFNTVFINAGGGYDARTGVFSCPVAGTYFFSASLLKTYTYNGAASCNIFKNSVSLVRAYTDQGNVGGAYAQYPAVTSVYVRLTVGDTVTLKSCTDIVASFSHESTFSGFLVTPN